MQGFFTKEETQSKTRPDGKVYSCASCGLYSKCDSPKMKPFGNFKKGILNIGGNTSRADDHKGKPWQGKAGRLLEGVLEELGIDLFEDCLNINAVNCYSEQTPTSYQIDCCRKSVLDVIEEYQPKVIILYGETALYSVIGKRWKKELKSISRWRGWNIPDKDFKSWVCPVFHPDFVGSDKETLTIWKRDLEQAINKTEVPFLRYSKPIIKVIDDLSILDGIKSGMIAFDYETTGIKPHAKGHRIICASVAVDEETCYTFMMPKKKKDKMPFIKLLERWQVQKMAHNMKFETIWSKVRLKTDVVNWVWDSMIAAHIYDNRPGISSLKFQTYVRLGVVDYDSEISPYLKGVDKSGNSLNKVQELIETKEGRDSLLHYCALDSIYQYRLAVLQQIEINYDFLPF